MTSYEWTTIATGLAFPEAPRWHDGRLHLSEIFGGRVVAIDRDGGVEPLVELAGRPSGLGWEPDGSMLVVSMLDRRLLRVRQGSTEVVAELGGLVRGDTNDMVVDRRGNAYIGSFGYDLHAGEERRAADLALVRPHGQASIVAEDLWFPNGMVTTPDDRTLLVAETSAERVTAFTTSDDGTLSDRRVHADLDGARPDGMALAADGSLWIASPGTGELLRVDRHGRVAERFPSPAGSALACALGGPDGTSLFICCSPSHDASEAEHRRGTVLATTVSVPAADTA